MIVRTALPGDLEFLIALEDRFYREGFIGQDDEAGHLDRMSEPGALYLIFERDNRPLGYAILRGLDSPRRNIELKRIAISEPGQGMGRDALRTIIHIAFTELNAHRLWLDVFPENERARRVYNALGFVEEGRARESVLRNGRFYTTILMSILEREYIATCAGGTHMKTISH